MHVASLPWGLILALILSGTVKAAWPQPAAPAIDRHVFLEQLAAGEAKLSNGRPPKEALADYRQALTLAIEATDFLGAALAEHFIGELYESQQSYQQALRHYESAITFLSEQQNTDAIRAHAEQALARLRSLEKIYRDPGSDPVSDDLYRGVIESPQALLNDTDGARKLLVSALTNAANLYLQQRQFRQADTLYEKAHALLDGNNPSLQRQLRTNQAWSALKQGDFGRADALLQSVLAESGQHQSVVELRRALLALGVNQSARGNLDAALTTLNNALPLYQAAGDEAGLAKTLAHLADTYLQLGDEQKARARYATALPLAEAPGREPTRMQVHRGLAQLYRQDGDDRAAADHYQAYFKIVGIVARRFGTDQGRVSILESHNAMLDSYIQILLKLAQKDSHYSRVRAVIESLREQSLNALQQHEFAAQPGELSELDPNYVIPDALWREIYLRIPHNQAVQMAPAAALPPELQNIHQQDSLMADINADPRPTDRRNSAELPSVTLLEYYVLAEQTVVLVKSANGEIRGAILPTGDSALQQRVRHYRQSLGIAEDARAGVTIQRGAIRLDEPLAEDGPGPDELSRQLYQMLIAPVEDWLPEHHTTQALMIVPHRALWLLPFAALQTTGGEFFGDRQVVAYTPSEQSWRLSAGRSRSDYKKARAWIVGNPRMPSSVEVCGAEFRFAPLPGARAEATGIAALFEAQNRELFLGAQADGLRLEAWHPGFSVIHLATHGVACPEDPLSSFIVLSALAPEQLSFEPLSGLLSYRQDPRLPVTVGAAEQLRAAMEVLQLDPQQLSTLQFTHSGILSARTIINRFQLRADLVTLSACQTGLGQVLGQGTVGFGRAFLAAGARSLLTSLWNVDDKTTQQLMLAFYRGYLDHGNKGLALQQAMQQLRDNYPQAQYWAPFTLLGMVE